MIFKAELRITINRRLDLHFDGNLGRVINVGFAIVSAGSSSLNDFQRLPVWTYQRRACRTRLWFFLRLDRNYSPSPSNGRNGFYVRTVNNRFMKNR